MKKKSTVVYAAILMVAFFSIITYFFVMQDVVQAQDLPSNGEALSNAEMSDAIAELRSLINLLVLNMNGIQETSSHQVDGIAQISGQRAREIALETVGYGTIRDAILFSENGSLTFEVDIRHGYVRYMVYVNAVNSEIVRIDRFEEDYTEAASVSSQPIIQQPNSMNFDAVTPRSSVRQGCPASPPVSAQRAVELAWDHLISIGVTNARFDYVYMDRERGRCVWSVEFDGQGRSFEFYVDVNTGEFLEAPRGDIGN